MLRSALFTALAGAAIAAPLAPSDLLVEYMRKPTIEVPNPRFFFQPQSEDRGAVQSAYQVVVASAATGAVVWDSGKVASALSTHIAYAGTPLTSDSVYNYTVAWSDGSGATSPPSSGEFSTGLLTQAEWAPAAWLGCPLHTAGAPNYNQLRVEFDLGLAPGVTIVQARAYLAAVGYAALRVNGAPAPHYSHGDRVRNDPGWTTYEVRALYSTYDVAGLLKASGPNALGIWQANGWPDIGPVPGNGTRASGLALGSGDNEGQNRASRMLLSVLDSTGARHTIATGAPAFEGRSSLQDAATWACGAGSLQYDNIYNGVTWDQRNYTAGWDAPGFAPAPPQWTPAVLRADPGGAYKTTMTSQAFPATTIQSELHALTINEPSPGVYVLDFGQNIAGFVRLTLAAPVEAGLTVTLRHAEILQHPPYGPADGSIYVGNLRSARATDVYTAGGSSQEDEVWEPPIGTYHGFRFVEVTGLPFPPSTDTVVALAIRADVDIAGSVAFDTAANTLNQLQHAVFWSIGNNIMSGVISDCPQRDERKGWAGDSALSLQPTHYNYKMGAFYTAWAASIRDAQQYQGDSHPPGSVPDTVPHTFGSYPADPAWGTVYPGVVYSTWRMLGDTRLAADHYGNLKQYIAFMQSEVDKGGITQLYQSYGDWCPPGGAMPPKHYTSGVAYLQDLQRMVELATALGESADAAAFAAQRAGLVAQFNAGWLQAGGVYGGQDGLQTANAAALFLNFTPSAAVPAVRAALAADVLAHDSHWSTGIIGMRYLHSALTEAGHGEMAVDTLLQTTYPSYGYMFSGVDETPATTLWELPDAPHTGPGMNSRAHHMFASVGSWLNEDILGLGQARQFSAAYDPSDAEAVAFRHAIIFPRVTTHPNLTSASGFYDSMAGRYVVEWSLQQSGAGGQCVADAPENAPVTLGCPSGAITGVAFASFGTPTGSCSTGFKAGACAAANTSTVISALCVGKTSCVVDVSTTTFGEPCYNTLKHLDVLLNCSSPGPTSIPLLLTATVPANARATVRIPFPASVPPAARRVTEGTTAVWGPAGYLPGVPGITGITPGTDSLPVGTATLDVEVGAGTYAFTAVY